MFMLRNVGKYIFGDSTKQDIIQLDQGQLWKGLDRTVGGRVGVGDDGDFEL